MSDDVKLNKGLEVLETLLYRTASSFLDASIIGDYELSMLFMTNAVTIQGRLIKIMGKTNADKIWAGAWKGIIER